VEVAELAIGLWRWTVEGAGSFYVEAPDATLVVDPLVPDDEAERFWRALDRDVERRGLPLAVLLTGAAHARSADDVAARYGGEVTRARGRFGAGLDDGPGGARVLQGPGTPLYLPSHDALAAGDALVSDGGALRLRSPLLAAAVRTWLALPVAHVLVAHGPQVEGGRDAIAAALSRAPA
jgi:glyoxylase-like metal-dependent hydrolase (beta-lactamase superfamily II)